MSSALAAKADELRAEGATVDLRRRSTAKPPASSPSPIP